jgi:two-component system cell cycle response regulator DivK
VKSVLIVEDEPIGAVLLKLMLSKHFNCESANNSEKCKTFCREEHFDFVILDINLGKDSINGLELLHQLKEFPKCKNTKFVAITAYAMTDDNKSFTKKGFDYYFSKPITYKDLIDTISSVEKDDTIGDES